MAGFVGLVAVLQGQENIAKKMEIGSTAWCRLIVDGAAALGVTVSPEQTGSLERYARELLRWNRKTNLTAICDPLEVAVKHLLDALTAAPYVPTGAVMLDMGSGGGFPGVPLKIVHPGATVTLVDSVRKKVSFLRHVIRLLGLKDIRALHTRVESLAHTADFRASLDVVTCRALAPLEVCARWGLPFLSAGGRLVFFKGPGLKEELQALCGLLKRVQARFDVRFDCEIKNIRLPVLNLERKLVIVQKIKATV